MVLVVLLIASTAVEGAKKDECTTIQSGELLSLTGDVLTAGYDEFGYNYQAHQFNGRYCDFDRVIRGDFCDVKLMMKWNDAWLSNKSCDGDVYLDRHYGSTSYIGSGAWLTNYMSGGTGEDHWTYFTKIVAAPGDAFTQWDLTGTYDIDYTCTSGCSGVYPHTMNVTFMDPNSGDFSGTGFYIPNPAYTWDVTGQVSNSTVDYEVVYNGLNPGYTVSALGTIAGNGTMSGIATSPGQDFSWLTVVGSATHYWYENDGTEIGPEIWGAFATILEVESDQGAIYKSPAGPGFGIWK